MKKLLIAAFAVVISASVHAAASWTGAITVYDYNNDIAAIGTIEFFINGISAGSAVAFDEYGDASFTAGEIAAGDTLKAIATVTNFSDGAGKYEWTFDYSSAFITTQPDEGSAVLAVNNDAINAFSNGDTFDLTQTVAANGYSPVPEPTSGLLLLIGMGVLALKRKHA